MSNTLSEVDHRTNQLHRDQAIGSLTGEERFRIHVPNPDCELQMGKTENNFVGIFARVARGGVFIGAGGFPFGLPSSLASYGAYRKMQVGLGIGINAGVQVVNLVRLLAYSSGAGKYDMMGGGLSVALQGAAVIAAGIAGAADDWSGPGTVSMYGDFGVTVCSPISVGATGGLSATVSGGLSASLNAIGVASVNAIASSVNGLYHGSVSGNMASLLAESKATLASRNGEMRIEGVDIFLGRPSGHPLMGAVEELGCLPGYAYMTLPIFTKGQKATRRIELKADDEILLEPGKGTENFGGAPNRFTVNKNGVRATSSAASLSVGQNVTAIAGRGVIRATDSAVSLMHSAVPIKQTAGKAVSAVEEAWKQARQKAIDAGTVKDESTWIGGIGVLSAFGVGLGATLSVALGAFGNVGKDGMFSLLGLPVGGLLGAATTKLILMRMASSVANEALQMAKKAADLAGAAAVKAAIMAETTTITAQRLVPTNPQIDILPTGIQLAVGKSKINITAIGIEIEAPMVKIKGAVPVVPVGVNGTNLTVLG